jgi:hypothetical protein
MTDGCGYISVSTTVHYFQFSIWNADWESNFYLQISIDMRYLHESEQYYRLLAHSYFITHRQLSRNFYLINIAMMMPMMQRPLL